MIPEISSQIENFDQKKSRLDFRIRNIIIFIKEKFLQI
jgi:hypothetical protein